MPHESILYGVSSVGLGHVRRSVAIANELHLLYPDLEIDWIAAEPALTFLESKGRKVLDVSRKLQSLSKAMENQASGGRISDISKVARDSSRIARENYLRLKPVLANYNFVIQDEFAETMFSFLWDKQAGQLKTVLITDYLEFETRSRNIMNRIVLWYANRALRQAILRSNLRIFADSMDSLNERGKRWINKFDFHVLGPIIGEIPGESKADIRKSILPALENRRVIVFTIGGTNIGRSLLEFASENADALSRELDALVVILCGPRVSNSDIRPKNGLLIVPFTPDALKYFKMADCVVAQAGASTLNEIASLGVPCVCVPIRNHWEQASNAKRFSQKFGFRILKYDELSVDSLCSEIKKAISYPADSSTTRDSKSAQRKAAELIGSLIEAGFGL